MRVLLIGFVLLLTACSGTQLLNTLSRGGDVVPASNIIFDDATGLRLDVYAPEGEGTQRPSVVFFYGGRWTEGRKEDFKFVGNSLAAEGIVTVIAEYRHYPAVRFPAFVEDAAKAVKWARSNLYKYGGSSKKLFVMGHSSGAHLAAMLAMNEQYLKGVGGSRTWLKGMVGLAGPYDFLPLTAPDLRDMFGPPEEFEKSQPIFYVDGNNPPLFLLHGEDDDQVWVKNTRNLAKAVKDAGGPVETVIYKEMSHRIIIGSLGPLLKGRSDVFENVVSFIKRVAEQAPATGPSGVQGQALKSEEPGVAPQPLGDAPTDAPRAIPPQP